MGPEPYGILQNLVQQDLPKGKSYDEIVKILVGHCMSKHWLETKEELTKLIRIKVVKSLCHNCMNEESLQQSIIISICYFCMSPNYASKLIAVDTIFSSYKILREY